MKPFLKLLLGALFFFIATLLLVVLWLPALICALVYSFLRLRFRQGVAHLAAYVYSVVQSIDQTGNVVAQHLFNHTLITSKGSRFGNPDETISSVLGRNEQTHTLTRAGRGLVSFLHFFDPGHAQKSIGS